MLEFKARGTVKAYMWDEPGDNGHTNWYTPNAAEDLYCGKCGRDKGAHGRIMNSREMSICPGDWLVFMSNGDIVPYKAEIFKATYEPVEEIA